MCPQNKVDIKGLIEAMNFSLQGIASLPLQDDYALAATSKSW